MRSVDGSATSSSEGAISNRQLSTDLRLGSNQNNLGILILQPLTRKPQLQDVN